MAGFSNNSVHPLDSAITVLLVRSETFLSLRLIVAKLKSETARQISKLIL